MSDADDHPDPDELLESVWAEARDLVERLEGSSVQRLARRGRRLQDRDRARRAQAVAAPARTAASRPAERPGGRRRRARARASRPGARAASGAFAAIDRRGRQPRARARAARRHLLPARRSRAPSRSSRRATWSTRPDRLHRRGDEADERGGRRRGRPGGRDRGRGRRAGRVRAGADVPRAGRRVGTRRVREGPDRQPGRDRPARRARLPRARHQVGGGLLHRRRRVGRRALRRRGRLHRPAAARQELPAHPERDRRGPEDRRRRDPPGLRLPLRGPLLRRDLRRQRHHLHRARART